MKLPAGWTLEPLEAHFHLDSAGDTEPIHVLRNPGRRAGAGAYASRPSPLRRPQLRNAAGSSVGYPGLRPYNQYKPAKLKTRKVDVKLAPGLRVGYIMGPAIVPEAIEALGVTPHLLIGAELASGDLSAWNAIVIGIRAYSTRPELALQPSRASTSSSAAAER